MLRKEAVSPQLLEALTLLMEMKTLKSFRLVGGTALALQIGHRISVDIDLFSDDKNDFEAIQQELGEKFGSKFVMGRSISNSLCKGIAVFLNDIKTDILDWKVKFIRSALIDENVRIAVKEDIIPMKFNTFLCAPEMARYEKKDFIDLMHLMKEYSLEQMISLYKERYPNEIMSPRLIIEGLQYNELADKKPMPKMLNTITWEDAKNQIEKSIEVFVKKRLS